MTLIWLVEMFLVINTDLATGTSFTWATYKYELVNWIRCHNIICLKTGNQHYLPKLVLPPTEVPSIPASTSLNFSTSTLSRGSEWVGIEADWMHISLAFLVLLLKLVEQRSTLTQTLWKFRNNTIYLSTSSSSPYQSTNSMNSSSMTCLYH